MIRSLRRGASTCWPRLRSTKRGSAFRFVRHELEDGLGRDRLLASWIRINGSAFNHKPTNTRLRVLSSDARTAFGIVGSPDARLLMSPVRGGRLRGSCYSMRSPRRKGSPDRLCGRCSSGRLRRRGLAGGVSSLRPVVFLEPTSKTLQGDLKKWRRPARGLPSKPAGTH